MPFVLCCPCSRLGWCASSLFSSLRRMHRCSCRCSPSRCSPSEACRADPATANGANSIANANANAIAIANANGGTRARTREKRLLSNSGRSNLISISNSISLWSFVLFLLFLTRLWVASTYRHRCRTGMEWATTYNSSDA